MLRRAEAAAAPAGRAGRSIALPIFLLVIMSVTVAAAVIFTVTFSGPPQLPVRDARLVASVLRTGIVPTDEDGPMLRFRRQPAPPRPHDPFHPDPAAASALATALDVPSTEIAAYTMRPPEDRGGSAFGRDFILGWHRGGEWRVVETPRPVLAPWHVQTLIAMLLAILVLAIPAWLIARAIARPLAALATAADQARAGANLPPLPTKGAREVRRLARSVATMHARLANHAQGRTTMLGAIAHDLGTPLSRIAFWIEHLPEPARTRAAADIEEMRGMIGTALAFARDDAGEHAATRIDLGSLLDSLTEDMAAAGAPVTLDAGERVIVRGDSGALRRLFANLIENAIRYGERARIGWTVAEGIVDVVIEDDGPGIDPATVERLFEPFVRGDPSRNRATGGTGLGLAIVRSIAVRHGGAATLENGAQGARARVTLPLSR